MKIDYRYILPALRWLWRVKPRVVITEKPYRRILWRIYTYEIRLEDRKKWDRQDEEEATKRERTQLF
jgi:hypothetical protein